MRTHTWARRCAVVAAVVATIAVAIAMRRDGHSAPAAAADGIAASAPIPDFVSARLARHRYRHSVIAGGALTREELAAAMREDAVVADHHKAVDIDRVRAIVTATPRMAYVSYRIGHRVFWTREPVQIPAGETLLTDGVTEIRGRCGNGVSDTSRQPVSNLEPPAHELDNLEGDSSTSGERTLSNTAPVGTPFVPFFQLAREAVLGGDGATDLPEEIRAVSGVPLALLAYLIDPPGSASNDGSSLFDATEPSVRGNLSSNPVNGGRPFLIGISGLGGSGNGSNGGEPNGGGSNGGGSNGGGSNDGGSNDGGSNGGGSNGGGSNGGGSNGGGSNGGGSNGGGSDGGGSNGGGSNGGGSNGGSDGGSGGGGQDPGDTLPTIYPGSEDLIEYDQNDDDIPAVPEPGALGLLGLGLAAAAARRRRA